LDKVNAGAKLKVFWLDPKSGESMADARSARKGVESFSTPEGWEDALLVAEPAATSFQ
jgi:hypothetical protein